MRTVYIEFTRPKTNKPLSCAIMAVEGTKYSHVRLRWKTSWGAETVYEASGVSVKFVGPVAMQERPVEVIHSYALQLSDEQYKALLRLCIEYSGLSYGTLQLVGILLVRVFGLVKNPLSRGRKSQVCSEIVGVFLQDILGIGRQLNLDIAGPRDIQKVLEDTLSSNVVSLR